MTSTTPANRFADYFVICGLDVASGLEPDRLSGERTCFIPIHIHQQYVCGYGRPVCRKNILICMCNIVFDIQNEFSISIFQDHSTL